MTYEREIKNAEHDAENLSETVGRAAELLNRRLGKVTEIAVVLGSGFAPLLERANVIAEVGFADVPGIEAPTVAGHSGRFVLAAFGGRTVLFQVGRLHFYEGHPMWRVTLSIRIMARLGVGTLLLTNAAGGIQNDFNAGDFMDISDHINLMGQNPLRASGVGEGQRFVNMVDAYDPTLRDKYFTSAKEHGITLRKGVYLAVPGPSYETPAEIGAFRLLGADAVGMCTVPETIVARSLGIRVTGLSCITNLAAGMTAHGPNHEEVLGVGRGQAGVARALVAIWLNVATG